MPTEFVVDESPADVLVDGLAEVLSARVEPRHDERRTWHDTFDWRLYKAGLLLEHRVRTGQAWLVLSDLDGRRIARMPSSRTQGMAVEDLPAGVIRDRVAKLAGIRALLPRASVAGPVTVLSALDDQAKTVARVAVEGPLGVEGGELLPRRLRVEGLRGYDREARKVARRLATVPGLEPAAEPLFSAAVRARGLRPGDYRSKPEIAFDPAMPADRAFAVVLDQLLEILLANIDGTLRQHDTEFLHDLRVAVRRTRSVLKMAKGIVDEDRRTGFASDFKWLGDVTTPSRDCDVYLLGFDGMAAEVPDPDALEPLRTLLDGHSRKAHTTLNRSLRSKRFAHLVDGWRSYLAEPEWSGAEARAPVALVADAQLRTAFRRVEKRGDAIDDTSPAESLHDLRKRCKELRYLLEFFASLYDPGVHREVIDELKRLQDNLGAFQDAEAQRYSVLRYAEELASVGAPASTLLALGRLEEHLERSQAAARAEFTDRWARFDRRHNRRAFAQLVGAR